LFFAMLRELWDSLLTRRRDVIKPSAPPPSSSTQPSFHPSAIEMSNVRVAVITGAGQGIGRAIAIRLAEDGMDVVVNDLESQRHHLEEVRDVIAARGRRALIFTGDVSDEQTVKTLISTVVDGLGAIDVVSHFRLACPSLLLTYFSEDGG
jgi:hypothetical protein